MPIKSAEIPYIIPVHNVKLKIQVACIIWEPGSRKGIRPRCPITNADRAKVAMKVIDIYWVMMNRVVSV